MGPFGAKDYRVRRPPVAPYPRAVPDLLKPDLRVHASYLAAMREEPETNSYLYDGDEATLADPQAFADYLQYLTAFEREETPRPDGFVPTTTLWWVDGEEFLGRVGIRHRLTDHLLAVGGHIGYWIRPSARRQGHATAAFSAALRVAYGLGIDPALLTCDEDNIGSRRVIEGAGGRFESRIGLKRRYWVPTRDPDAAHSGRGAGAG
jgi:predicted acetyltransferase